MTLGAGTFVPSAKFTFPRSYLAGVWFQFNAGSTVTPHANVFDVVDVSVIVTARITLAPECYDWNSNAYTMDFLIIESWYKVAPSPVENPLPFALTYYSDPATKFPYVVYQPFSSVGAQNFKFLLPPAPLDYYGPRYT